LKFTLLHRSHFNCTDGAYSQVTEREVFDSQITLTDTEVAIVTKVFQGQIHRGNVQTAPEKARQQFWNLNTGTWVGLNLVYPKPERDELRLYLSSKAGFKPTANDVWYLFERDSKLNIGSQSINKWRSIGRLDESDPDYQVQIFDSIVEALAPRYVNVTSSTKAFRDPKLAVERFQIANYRCEFDAKCRLFLGRGSERNFLECHHIIPMQFQSDFKRSLDFVSNLIALCPFCHRDSSRASWFDSTNVDQDHFESSRSA
jgi:5-methylcytosine-specific restriction enzyme A